VFHIINTYIANVKLDEIYLSLFYSRGTVLRDPHVRNRFRA